MIIPQHQGYAQCGEHLHQLFDAHDARVAFNLCDTGLPHAQHLPKRGLGEAARLPECSQVLAELAGQVEGVVHVVLSAKANIYAKASFCKILALAYFAMYWELPEEGTTLPNHARWPALATLGIRFALV